MLKAMSTWTYVLKSLFFHRRINLALALGVAAATAVLTGALIVGDSMRGSLRDITLDRLGRVDEALVSDLFFRQELASELASDSQFQQNYQLAVSSIFLPDTTAERTSDGRLAETASGVTLFGCGKDFWSLAEGLPEVPELGSSEIIINQQLADELGVVRDSIGDGEPVLLTLRIARQQAVSADSPIGTKVDNSIGIPRLKVIAVLPDESIARFGLQPSQLLPSNAFVSIDLVQEVLEQPGKANAIFVAGDSPGNPPDANASKQLQAALHPTLEDRGLLLRDVAQKYTVDDQEQTAFEYQTLSSVRMMINPQTDRILKSVLPDGNCRPVLTYLANRISLSDSKEEDERDASAIPFSMVTAIEFGSDFSLQSSDGQPIAELNDDEIVLNSWAADDLGAKPGDKVFVTYFEPETSHGKNVETTVAFRLKAIAKLTEPSRPYELSKSNRREQPAVYDALPTAANDPDLTPFVPGVTDRDSIENWDLPFETRGIRAKDDRYWKEYRTTPKAFITLARGRSLWASRFGKTTSLRIDSSKQVDASNLAKKVNEAALQSNDGPGLTFMPLKRDGLKASSGSTPFDALFLSLSFFIIASAIMLVALLFRLGIEQRANEFGVLSAAGVDRSRSIWLMIREGTIVSLIGALIGLVIGIGYAWLMLTGLTTIWVEAIVTPFLKLHISSRSLIIGLVSGVAICAVTIAVALMRTKLHSVRSLLAGQLEMPATAGDHKRSWLSRAMAIACVVGAIVLSLSAILLPDLISGSEAQAGAFVGSGFLLLTGILTVVWQKLRTVSAVNHDAAGLNLLSVAARNAGRKPGRSTLTIGLVAIATFLIVAISSFHLSPDKHGTGGFQWVAQSDRPLHFDLNDVSERTKLFGDDAAHWNLGETITMRLKPGADASCNNPYQVSQPRVLGVTRRNIEQLQQKPDESFSWAGSIAKTEEERVNPWLVLETKLDEPDRIPVVIDKNTAMYSLKLFSVGQDFELHYDEYGTIKFRVAGFLANSILQGSLLMSEDNFETLFPEISGYRYFLVGRNATKAVANGRSEHTATNATTDAAEVERGLSEFGFDMRDTSRLLESLLAVQNTYLKAFQSLGSLGLLLGTFGLATVQMRNVFERRKELALLSAVGFPKSRLGSLVLLEHVMLLLGGLLIGLIAAFFAVLPHAWFGSAVVPWTQLAILLAVVTIVGLLTGVLTVRSSLKMPLLSALRGE